MAIQSRVAPSLKVSDHTLSIAKPPASATTNRQDRLPFTALQHGDLEFGTPPAKRRKFEIVHHRQTTLDAFAVSHPPLPTRLSRGDNIQPNGPQPLQKNPTSMPSHPVTVDNAPGRSLRNALSATKAQDSDAASQSHEGPAEKKDDRRTLRSQDEGPRLKSELAIYFPDYEDVMLDAPREPDFVTIDSTLYITDVSHKTSKDQASPLQSVKSTSQLSASDNAPSVNPHVSTQRRLSGSAQQLNDSLQSNLETITRTLPEQFDDPLTDEHFFKAHRRAERKEKQLRNIERERAMHEKVQLERILDGLLGHDWLKVLGMTGITDGESRKYERKRDYFVKEVQTLVNKFKQWKEQEKKQRLVKEEAAALARRAESDDHDSDQDGDGDDESIGTPSSDLNASATRQLQHEVAIAAKTPAKLKLLAGKNKMSMTNSPGKPSLVYVQTLPEVPIVSFYDKRHLRDAALGKARHGRNVTAFGHPIPEIEEIDFRLPQEYVTEDALRSNARQRRRRKRESAAGPT